MSVGVTGMQELSKPIVSSSLFGINYFVIFSFPHGIHHSPLPPRRGDPVNFKKFPEEGGQNI